MKIYNLRIAAYIAALLSSTIAHATVESLGISSVLSDFKNSSVSDNVARTIPTSTGGGFQNNFSNDAITVGATVSQFGVSRYDGSTATNLGAFADLRIRYLGTYNNATGQLVPLTELFVARTLDSQGYTVDRSVSILLSQSSNNQSSRFSFEWYESGTNTPLNVQVKTTTLDIDARQEFKIATSDVVQKGLATGSTLQSVDSKFVNGLSWSSVYSTTATSSEFGDPLVAAQFLTTESSTQTYEVGKTASATGSYALFMFEFQTPSPTVGDLTVVTLIPEPSTYVAITSIAVLGFVAYRRRRTA
jgi:hypothetical protein